MENNKQLISDAEIDEILLSKYKEVIEISTGLPKNIENGIKVRSILAIGVLFQFADRMHLYESRMEYYFIGRKNLIRAEEGTHIA